MFKCENCNREFTTNQGLGQHKSFMHGPNSSQLREMRSISRKNQTPPTKGKNKSNFPGLARPKKIGKKFGLSLHGHTEETRKKISEKMKGNRNANHRGDRQSYYKDIRMDSSWEVGTAQYLDNNNN